MHRRWIKKSIVINQINERARQIVIKRIYGYFFYNISKILGVLENFAKVIDVRAKENIRIY